MTRLASFSSAELYDAGGRRCAMDRAIKPVHRGMRLAGRAYTVRCASGDNLALHRAITRVGTGQILVIATSGGHEQSYCGAVLCAGAAHQGAAGIVLDGYIRDSDEIAEGSLPVFCRGAAHVGAVKRAPGELEIDVTCGGLHVALGQLIVGDGDGVVGVPPDDEDSVLLRAVSARQREQDLRRGIAAGRTTLEILGLESEGARA